MVQFESIAWSTESASMLNTACDVTRTLLAWLLHTVFHPFLFCRRLMTSWIDSQHMKRSVPWWFIFLIPKELFNDNSACKFAKLITSICEQNNADVNHTSLKEMEGEN